MIEWLYRATIESSILIVAILLLAPILRRILSARIAYWMWLLPLVVIIFWRKPEQPQAMLEAAGLPEGGISLSLVTPENVLFLSDALPLLYLWLLGVISWIAFRAYAWQRMQKLLKSESQKCDIPSTTKQELPTQLQGIKANYYRTQIPGAPFVTGLFRPRIYLPIDFEKTFTPSQQKWILIHELTHIQRQDLWSQLCAEFVRACFWFNPIIHYAWSSFREDQELACDHQAIKNCNNQERLQYGEAMLQGMSANLLPATLAFFTLKKERFIMLKKHKKSKLKEIVGLGLCAIISVLAVTKAPSTIAYNNESSQENLYLNFEGIPLVNFTQMIADFLDKEIIGIEQLSETENITLRLLDVPPLETIEFVLGCYGFSTTLDENYMTIYESDISHSEKCQQLKNKKLLHEIKPTENTNKEPPASLFTQGIIDLINAGGSRNSIKTFNEEFMETPMNPIRLISKDIQKINTIYGKLEEVENTQIRNLNDEVKIIQVAAKSKNKDQAYYFNYIVERNETPKVLYVNFSTDNIQ